MSFEPWESGLSHGALCSGRSFQKCYFFGDFPKTIFSKSFISIGKQHAGSKPWCPLDSPWKITLEKCVSAFYDRSKSQKTRSYDRGRKIGVESSTDSYSAISESITLKFSQVSKLDESFQKMYYMRGFKIAVRQPLFHFTEGLWYPARRKHRKSRKKRRCKTACHTVRWETWSTS